MTSLWGSRINSWLRIRTNHEDWFLPLPNLAHAYAHAHTLAKTRCNQWVRCKDASTKCPRFFQFFCSVRSFHWFLKCFLWYQIASKLSSFSRGAPEPLTSRKHVWYNHNHNGRAQNEREKDNSTKFLTLARRERSSGVATFFWRARCEM